MSFRDIGVILNKAVEEKTERIKQDEADQNREQEEQDLSLATQAYMGSKQVVDVLVIANDDLPALEERFNRLRTDVSILQFRKRTGERNLYILNNQISTTSRLLNSLRISCIRERREIENVYNEKVRIMNLVTYFKNNNKEYLNKIKQAAEEKVKDVLTNSKLLLKFATLSVIESLITNPELYNFISYSTSVEITTTYGSNHLSLVSLGRQQQQQLFNDNYTYLILEQSEKLYNKLTTELTNRIMVAAAAITASSLPSYNNNRN